MNTRGIGTEIESWASRRVHDAVAEIVLEYVVSGGLIFDVGCGPGGLSQRLARKGFSVIAADAFPEVFQLHGEIPFVKLDVEEEWTSIEEGFDAVVAVEIIEHVENPYLFIRKCFAVLKPGGVLVLTTPNAAHYVSRVMYLLSGAFELYSPRSWSSHTMTKKGAELPPHIHLYTGWMIQGNLERAGFKAVRFFSCTNWLTGLVPIPRRPLNLLRWFCHRLFGMLACPFMRSYAGDSIFSKNLVVMTEKPRS